MHTHTFSSRNENIFPSKLLSLKNPYLEEAKLNNSLDFHCKMNLSLGMLRHSALKRNVDYVCMLILTNHFLQNYAARVCFVYVANEAIQSRPSV